MSFDFNSSVIRCWLRAPHRRALGHALCRLGRDRRGTAAMEMAMIMPMLFMLMLGTLEIGRYIFTLESLRSVTAEAARLAMVNSSLQNTGIVPGGADITSCTLSSSVNLAATRKTPFIDSSTSKLTLCIERTGTTNVTIRVLAQYDFATFLPYITSMSGTMTDRTTVQYRAN